MTRKPAMPKPKTIRCAIYTRKSTEDGLEQDFNSLDAQRESGEAFIKSQKHEGWECVTVRYDDGGFTGANMERPALRRLLSDIEAKRIDCVVVYKVDRLSRSLLDFARIMETFDKHHVSFVSVTQAFNTGSSMGRLVLNVLLSFAQFEREMISERTRDKIAATRRKGKWSGGPPILGYKVENAKLVVVPAEADQIRQIFELYLEQRSVLSVVKELERRGWRNKQWTTKSGEVRGGGCFTKTNLHHLLTNVVYAGKVRYIQETHPGEHQRIIDDKTFDAVQKLLSENGRDCGRGVRNKHSAVLRGLLKCGTCGCSMNHSYTQKGSRVYRYYVCQRAQKQGWHLCKSPSIPAGEIERYVVEQIRAIVQDQKLLRATIDETQHQHRAEVARLESEHACIASAIRLLQAELNRTPASSMELNTALCERIAQDESQLQCIESQLVSLNATTVCEQEVAESLARFDDVWRVLSQSEQARLVSLLVVTIAYDGEQGELEISYQPSALKTLAIEVRNLQETAA